MKATYIDYSETNSFSPAVIRYLEQDPQLAPFISHQPTVEGFKQLIANRQNVCDRQALVKVLTEQYAEIDSDEQHASLVSKNIQLLSKDTTYTITTGHQLNLFTGPLYFIFKIVTAINLAKELKSNFPEKDFVPVYWMATEDHDFDEINHTYIGGKKIEWPHSAEGATGRLCLNDIASVIKEYTGVLGFSENAEKLAELVEKAYLEHSSLASATRYLVNGLFGEYGLVIIDADHPELKKQFTSIIQDDIIQQNSFKTISSSIEKLLSAGVDAQVNPREINFFYLSDSLRERIVSENNRYSVLNTDINFSEDELKQEIHLHPERFSPNVVMRPLYQEVILPNISYVGGGAEVVYWLQLKDNFEHYGIDFPILILRNSALVGGTRLSETIKNLNLSPADLFKSADDLKKKWVLEHSEHTLNLADEWLEFKCLFEKIKLRTHKIDPTLTASTEAVRARLARAIHNLEKKLLKAEKRNHSDSLNRIDNFKKALFPKDGLQERSENFGLFYVKYGSEFISSLINTFKPLDFKFTILQ